MNVKAKTFICVCGNRVWKTIDSRPLLDAGEYQIRRRRECLKCRERITTYETVYREKGWSNWSI